MRLLVVPHYESLSVSKSFYRVLEYYPDLEDYFPIYSASYIPPRSFFWKVFGTLHYDDAKEFIDQERQARYQQEENDNERIIQINPEILKALEAVNYFSKKKGRALFKMKEKALPVINKTRKHRHESNQKGQSPFVMELDDRRPNRLMKKSLNGDSESVMMVDLRKGNYESSQHEMKTPDGKRQKLFSVDRGQHGLSAD